jgi:hypothetical protein
MMPIKPKSAVQDKRMERRSRGDSLKIFVAILHLLFTEIQSNRIFPATGNLFCTVDERQEAVHALLAFVMAGSISVL